MAGLLAGVVVTTVLGVSGIVWQWRLAEAATIIANDKAESEKKATKKAQKAEKVAIDARDKESALRQQVQHQLADLFTANGTRSLDEGDAASALPWLAAAQRTDFDAYPLEPDRKNAESNRAIHEQLHRLRLAAAFERFPKLTRMSLHRDRVRGLQFSAESRWLASASWDGTVQVLDVTTGNPVCPPLKHADHVTTALFSPDHSRIVTTCDDRRTRMFEVATTRELFAIHRPEGAAHAEFSPDRDRLLICGESVELFSAKTGEPLKVNIGDTQQHATFSPDGKRIATADYDNTARVWDATTGEKVGLPLKHRDHVMMTAFSPDSRLVATGSTHQIVQVWDAATGKPDQLTSLAQLRSGQRPDHSGSLEPLPAAELFRMWQPFPPK